MMYKTELHCHSKESSVCGKATIQDTIDQYVENGYTTLVLTNHYNKASEFEARVNKHVPFVDYFLEAYRIGKEYAKGKINLLLGCELRFILGDDPNDYLLYGVDEDFMMGHPYLPYMNIADVHKLCKENGILVIQAHPFRFDQKLLNPQNIDGVEVFNGSLEGANHNDFTTMWANYYPQYIKTCGTDHHALTEETKTAILTEKPITTEKELVDVLYNGNYTMWMSQTAIDQVPPPHVYGDK